jgi:NAD(P)-dependent dehydrogenase (short-subunit alcohol dehydrogenase family)
LSASQRILRCNKESFGGTDGGIANIAGTPGKSFGVHQMWEQAMEEYDRIIDTNVRGTSNFLAESLKPGLLEEPVSIVNTGSFAFCGAIAEAPCIAQLNTLLLG